MRRREESGSGSLGGGYHPPPQQTTQQMLKEGSNSDVSESGSMSRGSYWKQYLYVLQEKAPYPKPVQCPYGILPDCPPYYGLEYHGMMAREDANGLLSGVGEGAFLVRGSQRNPGYTLCMYFNGKTLNYKLYFDGKHYVGEKRFDRMEDLVADGLICMFLDLHAAEYVNNMAEEAIYEESPYSQYQRMASSAVHHPSTSLLLLDTSSSSPLLSNNNHNSPSSSMSIPGTSASSSGTLVIPQIQHKVHKFKTHTFRVASYCDFCRNFMWGLVQQGVKCEDCGFAAHRKCSEKTLDDCQPHLRYVRRTFAVDLTTLCMAHKVDIPPIVEQCVREVEHRGLKMEGIYRVSGSHDEVEKLRMAFDTQKVENGRLSRVEDIHSVASLLKLYLRLLPQPLITFSVYKFLMNAYRSGGLSDPEKGQKMRAAIEKLPTSHQNTLRVILRHLCTIAIHAGHSKMTAENLARVFSPTLLCAGSPQHTMIGLPPQDHCLLQFLITNNHLIYPPKG